MDRNRDRSKEMNVLTHVILFWAGTWYRPVIGFFGATAITMIISLYVLGKPLSVEMALNCASGPLMVIVFALILKSMYGKPE